MTHADEEAVHRAYAQRLGVTDPITYDIASPAVDEARELLAASLDVEPNDLSRDYEVACAAVEQARAEREFATQSAEADREADLLWELYRPNLGAAS
jgi:hypothetical protein